MDKTCVSIGLLVMYVVYMVRLICILSFCRNEQNVVSDGNQLQLKAKYDGALRIFVFLGSGGHTGEMIRLLENYGKLLLAENNTILVGYSDARSRQSFEQLASRKHLRCKIEYYEFVKAREVNSGLLSSLLSVLLTLVDACLKVVRISFKLSRNPHLVLLNGPGTCCILALWFKLIEWVNLLQPRSNIVYVESLARIHTLSLSGKVLYWLADSFIVQWKELLVEHPRAKYFGILV